MIGLAALLTACGGSATPASSAPGASAKPAVSAGVAASASAATAKPAASGGASASAKPVASAGAGASANPAASGLTKITYGVAGVSAFSWPHFAAVQTGAFQKQGIQLEEVATGTPATAAKALVGNSLDVAEGAVDAFAAAIEEGAQVSMVSQKIGNPAFSVITQPDIKTWDQVKGAKVAVSSPTEAAAIVFNVLAKKHGLAAQKDYSFQGVGITPARYAALQSKQVQVAIMNQPVDFQAIADGFNQLERSDLTLDHYAFIVEVVSKAWAQSHKDLLTRFLTAEVAGVNWLYDPANKQAAIDLLVNKTKVAPDAASKTYDVYVGTNGKVVSKGAKFDMEGIRAYADAIAESGTLMGPLDPAKWIDDSYINAVK
jgi:NitT/TauT family transport system substrate-binding protein